jgi:hypothetical protein
VTLRTPAGIPWELRTPSVISTATKSSVMSVRSKMLTTHKLSGGFMTLCPPAGGGGAYRPTSFVFTMRVWVPVWDR